MNDDPLGDLLRRADHTAGPPLGLPDDLANEVRRLAGQRRRARRITRSALAAGLVFAAGMGLFTRMMPSTGASPNNQPVVAQLDANEQEIARLRSEIADLRRQARAQTDLIQRIQDRQRREQSLARLERALARPDPIELVNRQRERAAFITVYQADRMLNELNLPDSAAESYRRVIDLFGQTRWADVAREKLAEIQKTKRGA